MSCHVLPDNVFHRIMFLLIDIYIFTGSCLKILVISQLLSCITCSYLFVPYFKPLFRVFICVFPSTTLPTYYKRFCILCHSSSILFSWNQLCIYFINLFWYRSQILSSWSRYTLKAFFLCALEIFLTLKILFLNKNV